MKFKKKKIKMDRVSLPISSTLRHPHNSRSEVRRSMTKGKATIQVVLTRVEALPKWKERWCKTQSKGNNLGNWGRGQVNDDQQ